MMRPTICLQFRSNSIKGKRVCPFVVHYSTTPYPTNGVSNCKFHLKFSGIV